MTVADILKIYGRDWIESTLLVSLVTQKMGINERQAYRKIKEAFKNREIRKAQLPDRGVLYGLAESGPLNSDRTSKSSAATLSSNDAFLYSSFNKLGEISNVAIDRPYSAFQRLKSLTATFPEELREKTKSLLTQVEKDVHTRHVEFPVAYKPVEGLGRSKDSILCDKKVFLGFEEVFERLWVPSSSKKRLKCLEEAPEDLKGPEYEDLKSECYSQVLWLVSEISSLLHEYSKREAEMKI